MSISDKDFRTEVYLKEQERHLKNQGQFLYALLFRAVSSTELPVLENMCKTILQEEQPFERLEVSKEVLLEMFKVIWETH